MVLDIFRELSSDSCRQGTCQSGQVTDRIDHVVNAGDIVESPICFAASLHLFEILDLPKSEIELKSFNSLEQRVIGVIAGDFEELVDRLDDSVALLFLLCIAQLDQRSGRGDGLSMTALLRLAAERASDQGQGRVDREAQVPITHTRE